MNYLYCVVGLTVLLAGCSPKKEVPDTTQPSKPTAPNSATPPKTTQGEPAQTAAPTVDQDKLVAELEPLGVSVSYSYQLRISPSALTDEGDFKPGIAEKLQQLEGISNVMALDLPMFGEGAAKVIAALPELTRIELWRSNAPDAAIAAFGECPTLQDLSFSIVGFSGEGPVVTDAGLAGLSKLKAVKTLDCQRGEITGAGLAAIAGFSELESLNLGGCPIDDAALPTLAKLKNLKSLNLDGSKINPTKLAETLKDHTKLLTLDLEGTSCNDDDLKAIVALKSLQNLSINGTDVTDAGAATLAQSQSLAELVLYDTKITDKGMAELAKLPKLRLLSLFRLPLTDATLVALEKAPELNQLWLGENKFTLAGIAKFKAARPKVKVYE